MSRTKRRKRWGQPGVDRDGRGHIKTGPTPEEMALEVRHPERREHDREADRIAKGDIDPDDTPVKPVRRHLWLLWRRW